MGITFATALTGQRRWLGILSLIVSTVMLIIGGEVGSQFANAIEGNEPLEIALLSFGTAALLYLVTEELLLEAHKGVEAEWWIDLCFFVGFWTSLILDKLSG